MPRYNEKRSPLHHAALENDVALVNELIAQEADFNAQARALRYRAVFRRSAVMICSSLLFQGM